MKENIAILCTKIATWNDLFPVKKQKDTLRRKVSATSISIPNKTEA